MCFPRSRSAPTRLALLFLCSSHQLLRTHKPVCSKTWDPSLYLLLLINQLVLPTYCLNSLGIHLSPPSLLFLPYSEPQGEAHDQEYHIPLGACEDHPFPSDLHVLRSLRSISPTKVIFPLGLPASTLAPSNHSPHSKPNHVTHILKAFPWPP